MKFVAVFLVLVVDSIQALDFMPMINPDTQKPYTPKNIIASARANGIIRDKVRGIQVPIIDSNRPHFPHFISIDHESESE